MRPHVLLTLLLMTFTLTGCEVIADIFRAGFWVGAIGVIIVVALIAWLVSRGRGRT
jgi:hypothetical protein